MFLNRFPFTTKEAKLPKNRWFKLSSQCSNYCICTDSQFNGSFHQVIGSVLLIAQCFAVMPVINIKSDSAAKLRFSWKSVRAIYSTIAFIGLISYTLVTVRSTLTGSINFTRIGWYFRLINEFKS